MNGETGLPQVRGFIWFGDHYSFLGVPTPRFGDSGTGHLADFPQQMPVEEYRDLRYEWRLP